MKNGIYFLAGLLFWVVAIGIFAGVLLLIGPGLSGTSSSSVTFKTIVLVVIGLLAFSPIFWGINLASQTLFGPQAHRFYPFIILLITFTLIGLLPVFYWTGKALVIRYHGEL